MDCPGSDPLAPKSVFGSSWIKKKSRYEDEDIALSPPDDSSFFSLRFGAQRTRANESMYDRINKELGLTLEGPKRCTTPELNVAPAASHSDGPPPQLVVGPQGISLANTSPHHGQHPKFQIITNPENNTPSTVIFPETILAGLPGYPDSTSCSSSHQDVDNLVRQARGRGRPTRKISVTPVAEPFDRSLLESVDELDIKGATPTTQPLSSFLNQPHQQQTSSGPSSVFTESSEPPCSVSSGLPTTGLPSSSSILDGIQKASPHANDRQRKTSAPPSLNPMLMETQRASNYFFTGSLFSSSSNSASTSTVDLSSSSTPSPEAEVHAQTQQPMSYPCSPQRHLDSGGNSAHGSNLSLEQSTSLMEERAKEAASLDPRPRMGKRRPKASALREMNFWAPQSM